MSWRRVRALTLVLLMLLIASPLSSGDKGLWLSFTASPPQLFEAAADALPTEHAILLPERASRPARAVVGSRPDRTEVARTLGPMGTVWSLGSGDRWALFEAASPHPHGEPFADRPPLRAPPA